MRAEEAAVAEACLERVAWVAAAAAASAAGTKDMRVVVARETAKAVGAGLVAAAALTAVKMAVAAVAGLEAPVAAGPLGAARSK